MVWLGAQHPGKWRLRAGLVLVRKGNQRNVFIVGVTNGPNKSCVLNRKLIPLPGLLPKKAGHRQTIAWDLVCSEVLTPHQ